MAVAYDELLAPYKFSSDNVSGTSDALYPNPELLFDDSGVSSFIDDASMSSSGVDDDAILESDADLRGRDAIDNIMYIYYGSNYGAKQGFGIELVIIGCVCALAAQSITVILLCLRNRRLKKMNALFPVVLNLTSCICVTNLIFIIGIQSTRPPLRCEMTALVLHYAHLVVAAWIFVYCHAISDHVTGNDSAFNMRYNCLMAYGAPAVFVLFAYAVTPDSYESKNYCWMSAQKGMFLNYMLPVTSLIIVNTVFATFALKSVNQKIQNALTVSIESILDPTNVPKIITSELNLDEELLFEASEWRSDFKNKNLMKSNLNKTLDIIESDQYQKTLDSLEKPKTTDQKNLNIYVDIENAKYSADNPNIFYEIGTSKDYEYQTVVEHAKETEKVPYYDCCDHHHRSNIDRSGDIGSVSLGDFSLQSSDFPELNDFRKCLRFAIFLQPAYDVCWFLGVVAVENATSSNVMPVVFIICFNILSWLIFARSASLCPLINQHSTASSNSDTSSTHNYHNCYDTINSRGGSSTKQHSCSMSDDIPLLLNASGPYSSAYRAGNADNELATTELASCSRSMTGADVICTITN